MKKFIDFIIEGLASPEQRSVQRGIEQFHNDAIRALLVRKEFKEKTEDGDLKESEFRFLEPSPGIKGDLHINFRGKIIKIECKGKNPDRDKHKNGTHQNDYIVTPHTIIGSSKSGRFGMGLNPDELMSELGGWDVMVQKKVKSRRKMTAPEDAAPEKITARLRLSSLIQRSIERAISTREKVKDEKYPRRTSRRIMGHIFRQKGMIQDLMNTTGSHLTISGSARGVAVIPHIPEDHKDRKHINEFLEHIGLLPSHEVENLRTAGSPEYRATVRDTDSTEPKQKFTGGRAIVRIGGISRNDHTDKNAETIYPAGSEHNPKGIGPENKQKTGKKQ